MPSPVFLFCRAPYASHRAREGIEALLASAVFDLAPKVIFMAQGLYQLAPQSDQLLQKNMSRLLSALPIYGVEAIYYQETSVPLGTFDTHHLQIPLAPMSNADIAASLRCAPWVARF
jgi:tRNA 2-thiouridine synthesizing protein C